MISSEYVVDFATMRQLNTHDERKSRPVQRREKQAHDEAEIALPEACPPEQEIEPEPDSEPLPEPETEPETVNSEPETLGPNGGNPTS